MTPGVLVRARGLNDTIALAVIQEGAGKRRWRSGVVDLGAFKEGNSRVRLEGCDFRVLVVVVVVAAAAVVAIVVSVVVAAVVAAVVAVVI